MTYVSRRARITVPRWPNEFDPEFLFRVGRRCDGRLKRLSSCHDLRAWINDNCIKNEYLLDLMSDGEVELQPPLQLYGRFIPVPVLFKLLQSSRSEDGPDNIDWEKIVQERASGSSVREKDKKASVLGPAYEEKDKKASALGPAYGEKDKKASALGPAYGEKDKRASVLGLAYGEKDKKASILGPAYGEKDRKKSVTGYFPDEKEKTKGSGVSFEGRDRSKGRKSISPKENVLKKESPNDDETPERGLDLEPRTEAPDYPSYRTVSRKWDPFEKMEYYTSGFATHGSLVEPAYPLAPTTSPTHSTIVMDDEYENKKSKSLYPNSESEGSLARALWEKDMIEKNLFKSTCLLTKAVGKLEKIDNIIQVANDEREKMRKGEIQEAFRKPTVNCIYLQSKNNTESGSSWGVKYRVRSLGEQERQDTIKCSELLRQISGLREKLKKNQECQQKINEEMAISQREAESGATSHMTDLNSDGDTQLRKLQRRLEKLINNRGKLLSDMCQALTQLNNLKRSKNSRVDMRQRTRSGENRNSTLRQEVLYCSCRNCQSSESEKAHYSDSGSSTYNHFRRPYGNFNRDDDKGYYYFTSTDNLDSGQQTLNDVTHTKTKALSEAFASNGEFYKDNQQEKEFRNSILRFCCPDPPCKQEPDADLDTSDRYFPSGRQSPKRGSLVNNPTLRPSTSPTTKREKWDASEEPRYVSYGHNPQEVAERRVKSETTMKEIEKTLRNYEQRLNDMDGLEYKVEEWKRKLLEACKWKRNASKVEAQMKREQENERNRASLEINGLFSQNYELKKQVRQLMDKSKEQAKKIQNMKSGILKARELESETEELKKELSEYRNSYEHQRKCITKWESVVALQRKEIENLMNHIRKLTTEKKEQVTICCQDRKFVQRTRSCSPVTFVDCQTYCRPQETYNLRSDEENGSCCCQDFRQSDSRRSQLRFFDKNYYSSLNERDDWCT